MKDYCIILLSAIITICLFLLAITGLMCLFRGHNNPPIKDTDKIDSLTIINDSIKLKVEHLDSIKNAKVIEVGSIDNDSTIKLFYKLVSE